MNPEVIIDEEFKALIPASSAEEIDLLTKSVIGQGCQDALKVWRTQDGDILLDGYTRHGICSKYGTEYDVKPVEVSTREQAREWILRNQLGRRNLNDFQRCELALKLEPHIREKAKANQQQSEGRGVKGLANLPNLIEPVDTREEVANVAGVSGRTLGKVKAIIESGDTAVIEAVRNDVDSIHKGFQKVKAAERREATPPPVVFNEHDVITDIKSLSDKKFGCIYADPPWQYGNQKTRASTDNHYDTMTVDDICAMPIGELAADKCHLHLWTTNGFLFDAKRVMDAWGFTYKSCFVWVKPQMGMGNYWRVSHEILLLGVRGDMVFNDHSLKSWAQWDRTEHSAKPDGTRVMIEKASDGPFLELFGRKSVSGWTVFGNQVERRLM